MKKIELGAHIEGKYPDHKLVVTLDGSRARVTFRRSNYDIIVFDSETEVFISEAFRIALRDFIADHPSDVITLQDE